MADDADRVVEQAQREEELRMERLRREAQARALRHATPECVDCGEDVGQVRQLHGYQTCYSCQVARETRARTRGR